MFTTEERARIQWRCRRGMLELDAFFVPFFENHFDSLTESQQQTFAELLEQEDQHLWQWFWGYKECSNTEFADLITLIKQKIATPQMPS